MRFPKWNIDGSKLLYEDGTGGIVLESGQESVTIRGNRPCWLTDTRWLYTKNNGATYEFGNPDPIFPRELHELASGGGAFGGVDRGVLFVRRANGSEERIPNAGQPFFDRDGNLFYREGDRFIEPTCLGDLRAWKDGNAVVTSWGHRYDGEGWPRLIWTPDGVELLTMTNTAILIRRVGTAHEGYERFTGADKNLEPDGVYRNGAICVACNSGILPPFKLSVKRGPFTGENGQTPEPPPMPTPPKLLAPNIKHLVERAMREHPEIVTKGTAGEKGRGAILDYAIGYADAEGTSRWYRKARNKDGTNLNTDALVFLRPDNRIEIYDAIGGGSGKATWTKPTKTLAIGENGYPVKPKQPTPEPGPGEPVPIPDVPSNVELRLQALEQEVKALKGKAVVSLRAMNSREVVRNSLDVPGKSTLQADRPNVAGNGELFELERHP